MNDVNKGKDEGDSQRNRKAQSCRRIARTTCVRQQKKQMKKKNHTRNQDEKKVYEKILKQYVIVALGDLNVQIVGED